jgi:hypothetical protein
MTLPKYTIITCVRTSIQRHSFGDAEKQVLQFRDRLLQPHHVHLLQLRRLVKVKMFLVCFKLFFR